MRSQIFKSVFVLTGLFLFVSHRPDDETEKNKVLINLIIQGLSSSHYRSIEINDEFSEKAFGLYLERLDFNKRFLTQPDVDRLKKYQHRIDDEAKNGTYELFDLSEDIIKQRIEEAQNYYRDILAGRFDFEKDETIELDGEKRIYAKDEAELQTFWEKYLKYQTLTELVNKLEIQEKAMEDNDTTLTIKTFEI